MPGSSLIGEDGLPNPFETNPRYGPTDDGLSADRIDVVTRRIDNGDNVDGAEFIAAAESRSRAAIEMSLWS